MTFDEYKILFREKAYFNGHGDQYVERCLAYAKPLLERRLPVIYNLDHFSQLVGYDQSYIKRAVISPRSFYYDYNVPKKNGSGVRLISQPFPSLKEIQYWILHNILYKTEISPYAKAYVPNRKFKENVRFHKKKELVVSYDITNFFPSIKKEKIELLFIELGYSNVLSNLFSKLLTHRGGLPQGAPTSPYLSNIYMIKFDTLVGNYCKENKLFYTRYADDLTFSANVEIDIYRLSSFIEIELAKLNLKLNKKKTSIMNANMRQIVTGLVVNEKIRTPIEFRKEIRKECFFIFKYGLDEHLKRNNCKNEKYYIKGLLGRINFVLQTDPTNKEFLKYRKEILPYIIKDLDLTDIAYSF